MLPKLSVYVDIPPAVRLNREGTVGGVQTFPRTHRSSNREGGVGGARIPAVSRALSRALSPPPSLPLGRTQLYPLYILSNCMLTLCAEQLCTVRLQCCMTLYRTALYTYVHVHVRVRRQPKPIMGS